MDGTIQHHLKLSKLGSKAHRSCAFPHMWKLSLKNKYIPKDNYYPILHIYMREKT
jgi:hypothetical protein